MGKIIWHEIKYSLAKNFREFVLLVMAFACSCIAINITLTNFIESKNEAASAKESYGDQTFYKLSLNGEDSVYQRVFGDDYTDETKDIFEELEADKDFRYLYRTTFDISFRDKSSSDTKNIKYPKEACSGYGEEYYDDTYFTENNDLYLKGVFADKLFCEEKNIHLADGEWFSDNDFYVKSAENMELPVILGAKYRQMYKVGDVINNANIWGAENVTFRVKGIFEQGSYFYDNNNDKVDLDAYMVIPDAKPTYSYDQANEIDKTFYNETYGKVLMNARIVCESKKADEVRARIYEILHDHELYEMKVFDESGGSRTYIASMKELVKTSGVITLFMLILGTVMFAMQSYYKLIKRKKTYAVYILNGITKKQILMMLVMDSLLVFGVADILFAIIYGINMMHPMFVWGITGYTIPVIIFLQVISMLFMTLFGYYQMNKMQMVTCLREHE